MTVLMTSAMLELSESITLVFIFDIIQYACKNWKGSRFVPASQFYERPDKGTVIRLKSSE